jgi:hypothetical protein
VIAAWTLACTSTGGAPPEPRPAGGFGRVGTGDTGATGATGDTGAGPVSCRVLREQSDYDHVDYSYVDLPTYTIRTATSSGGSTPRVQTRDPAGYVLSEWMGPNFGVSGYFNDDAGRRLTVRIFSSPVTEEDWVDQYTYDGTGHEVSHLWVLNQNVPTNADGIILRTNTYDAEGRHLGWGYDHLADGVLEGVGTLTYDAEGLLLEQHDDWDALTPGDWNSTTTRWEYDERGLPTRSELEAVSPFGDRTCGVREYTYDDRRDLVVVENVSCVTGLVFIRITDTWDDQHRRIESVWDLIDTLHPGVDDDHWWWTFDEHGNLTSEVRRQSGLSLKTTTWTWECR